jgi:hypothetical protein
MGKQLSSVIDYEAAVQGLRHSAEAHLRSRGRKHTSSTPGCYWMWVAEIDGQKFMVDFDVAMRVQGWREAKERYPDGPPSSRRPGGDD